MYETQVRLITSLLVAIIHRTYDMIWHWSQVSMKYTSSIAASLADLKLQPRASSPPSLGGELMAAL